MRSFLHIFPFNSFAINGNEMLASGESTPACLFLLENCPGEKETFKDSVEDGKHGDKAHCATFKANH